MNLLVASAVHSCNFVAASANPPHELLQLTSGQHWPYRQSNVGPGSQFSFMPICRSSENAFR